MAQDIGNTIGLSEGFESSVKCSKYFVYDMYVPFFARFSHGRGLSNSASAATVWQLMHILTSAIHMKVLAGLPERLLLPHAKMWMTPPSLPPCMPYSRMYRLLGVRPIIFATQVGLVHHIAQSIARHRKLVFNLMDVVAEVRRTVSHTT